MLFDKTWWKDHGVKEDQVSQGSSRAKIVDMLVEQLQDQRKINQTMFESLCWLLEENERLAKENIVT